MRRAYNWLEEVVDKILERIDNTLDPGPKVVRSGILPKLSVGQR